VQRLEVGIDEADVGEHEDDRGVGDARLAQRRGTDGTPRTKWCCG
jgi:hypothetical protein